MTETRYFRVAIAQVAPVYYNKAASLVKALDVIRDAANQRAKVVVFGETWFSGYPAWLDVCPAAALWNHEPTKETFARLRENSISFDGPEAAQLSAAAREITSQSLSGLTNVWKEVPRKKPFTTPF